MFEEPGDCMDCSQLEVFQVVESGCALAHVDGTFGATVFIIPDEKQHFYDHQRIILDNGLGAQRVGTYKYIDNVGMERTVPAVRIIDGAELRKSDTAVADQNNSGKTLFDKPGECVSRKNFKIKEVLESGDAIALEIKEVIYGSVFTSDLEVLILAQDDSNFYDNQIVKAPKGKCARQIGNYKYQQQYGGTRGIPRVAFK